MGDLTYVEVTALPPCDLCGDSTLAEFDAKMRIGPWAFLCEYHFRAAGCELGTGKGQRLILST